MHVCVGAWDSVCVCVCVHAYVSVCVCVYVCVFVCVCVHAASEHGNSYSIILYETTMRCSPDYRLLTFLHGIQTFFLDY